MITNSSEIQTVQNETRIGNKVTPPSVAKKITENAKMTLLPTKINGTKMLDTYALLRQKISFSKDVGSLIPS